MSGIVILVVLLGSIAFSQRGSAEEVQPQIHIKASGYTQDDVNMMIASFKTFCQPLGDDYYWSDIVEIRADLAEEIDRSRLDRGWNVSLHLQLRLSEKPRHLPEYRRGEKLAGETLHYHLGGGKTPGFISKKRLAQYLCGAEVDPSGADVFTDVPGLVYIDAPAIKLKLRCAFPSRGAAHLSA
jgi:hypothetical protein